MLQSLSQSRNSASPGLNALGTPGIGALGIEGLTPGALLNIPTPLAFAMSRSDSELRMVNSAVKRNQDEHRRAKTRKVLKTIGQPKGRVGEEGIARLARRVGMVSDIDDEKLTQEERDRKVGNRSFSVAGDNVIVTIDLKDQAPQSVEVNDDVPEPHEAARVLLADLRASGDAALTASLDHFALNLSYLAQMDRLKKETDTDCFAAIGGIYRSLRRLYEQECEALSDRHNGSAGLSAMCKNSGRPMMHARRRLGLRLDYWQQSRFPSQRHTQGDAAMDVDEPDNDGLVNDDKDICTILVGIEKYNALRMPFVPLRISDKWLPEQIELPSADSGETVKWLEPSDDEGALSRPCFNAKLDPPVVLPYGAADAILKSFNVQNVPDMQTIPSYTSLLLAAVSGTAVSQSFASDGFGSFFAHQDVVSLHNGDETTAHHRYGIKNAKPDFGFLLRELPFSHPKQLVELLPTLRQWAGFGTLLKQVFSDGTRTDVTQANGRRPEVRTVVTLESLGLESAVTPNEGPLPVNVVLLTSPSPTLNMTFRTTSSRPAIANIDIQILRNADVAVEIHDGYDFDDQAAKTRAEQTLAKALDVCWDLGVWVEWVRRQYGRD